MRLASVRAVLRVLFVAAVGAAPGVAASPVELTVMTRNLYFGADLAPLAAAPDLPSLVGAVTVAYGKVVASDPAARIAGIASEIMAAQPDIVGLQEAVIWRTRTPSIFTGSPGAETVAYDFLQMLLADLGPAYTLAIASQNIDAAAPGLLGGVLSDIRLTDRDAILVRSDLPILGTGSAVYSDFVQFPIAGTTVESLRTYAYVDIGLAAGTVRVVSTHLDPDDPAIQVAQGNELIAALDGVSLPQIVLGDFNSRADGLGTATYANMLAAGFADAWLDGGIGDGFTCCQAEDLLNDPSALDERIDFVFHRGGIKTLSADVVGDELADRTASGLWPSDHAGVLVTLLVVPEPGGLVLVGIGLLGVCLSRRRHRPAGRAGDGCGGARPTSGP